MVEKQGSDCSKHITLVITSCYVLMKPSYVEVTGHKTKSLKKKKQLTSIKPPGKGWFWTVSCWVSTYIGLISCGVAFIKKHGINWTDVPISCDNAFMADQWRCPTARVQQQQNIHYSYTHELYTYENQGSEYTWFIYTLWQLPSEAKWYDAHIFSSCKLKVACKSKMPPK